jgi:16S rRNA (guanine966-N2)-methyltransferase
MGQIRIIAGSLKSRRIRVPTGEAVRPTSDRAREALFNILGSRVAGASVLDLYAGSGALGIEAFSRGASVVTFLEADRKVLQVLQDNLRDLGIPDHCRAVQGKVEESEGRIMSVAPYGLILADPPYGIYPGDSLLQWASKPGLFEPEGALVLERSRRTDPAEGEGTRFRLERSARYGRIVLDFYSARF